MSIKNVIKSFCLVSSHSLRHAVLKAQQQGKLSSEPSEDLASYKIHYRYCKSSFPRTWFQRDSKFSLLFTSKSNNWDYECFVENARDDCIRRRNAYADGEERRSDPPIRSRYSITLKEACRVCCVNRRSFVKYSTQKAQIIIAETRSPTSCDT